MATNNLETTEQSVSHEVTIYAEPIFHIGGLEVTNSLLTSWLAVLIVLIFSIIIRINLKKIPGKLQHVFEIILGGAISLVDQVTNDRKVSNKIFPIVFSVFVFVLINNWVGILPFIGSVGYYAMHDGHNVFVPFFRGGTADINTTLTLGIVAVVGSNLFGIITLGAWKTLNKYVKLQELGSIFTKVRKDPSVLVVAPVSFFVGIIELIGEVAKIASLSFRLFGNIFAGEVLLSSMAAILAFILPTPFLFLEVFIGLIQALIFALLTTVYFTIAAQDHSEHEEHEHEKGKDSRKEELVHI
ncbi:MAG: F0F1 ATP synthase subunit A [Candidatus Pacebacteria bacterium]|nr:F0F1 ATP synthase subunit A [Candidatus Paceibacterota bacterium]MBP9851527.1 F0F1 ATP synthase subunit A [Candidatus Paceibacterota bacterium]